MKNRKDSNFRVVECKRVANEKVLIMLFEPATIYNLADIGSELKMCHE